MVYAYSQGNVHLQMFIHTFINFFFLIDSVNDGKINQTRLYGNKSGHRTRVGRRFRFFLSRLCARKVVAR